MDAFFALSAPIRREIIALLSDGNQLTATAIADSFQVTPAAISQHLKVLLSSDIVTMHKHAQKRLYALNPTSLLELESWAKSMVKNIEKIGDILESKNTASEIAH